MCNELERIAFCIWRIIDSHLSPTSSLIFYYYYYYYYYAIENGNLSMRKKLVMTSAFHRPPVRTGREGLSRFCRGGDREYKICSLRCFWRNVNQFSSPRGNQWSFSSKDIEFSLFDLRQKNIKYNFKNVS